MVQSFNRAFSEAGVHIGLISVGGAVKPENKVLNPKTIAERTVTFWENGSTGELEINIQD